jgi:hypothetical protein
LTVAQVGGTFPKTTVFSAILQFVERSARIARGAFHAVRE